MSNTNYKQLWLDELNKSAPDIEKLEEYKNLGNIDVNANVFEHANPLSLILGKKTDIAVIEALLKMGANPNKELKLYPKYPVYYSVFSRDINEIKPILLLLIKYNANIKVVVENTVQPTSIITFIVISYKKTNVLTQEHYDIADILIANGCDIHYRSDIIGDVLDECIIHADSRAIKYFIDKGVQFIINGKTRLHMALKKYYGDAQKQLTILQILLQYHSNHNDYFREMLDYLEENNKPYVFNLFSDLETALTPNYNEVYSDRSTPLIQAVKIYEKNPIEPAKALITRMLAKGANPGYIDSVGKKASDYTSREEIKELLGYKNEVEMGNNDKPSFKLLWTGFSKSDIDFTNNVFHQVTHHEDLSIQNPKESLFSICPVCLKHIQHETGSCMYMTHSCVEQAGFRGYYHKKLWNAFSYGKEYDAQGNRIPVEHRKKVIEWCTNCGRICKNHDHYKLGPVYNKDGSVHIPKVIDGSEYFSADCTKHGIGGGGIAEKINRYRKFREVVLTLNNPKLINKLSYESAIDTLVEAVWEAPLNPQQYKIGKIQRNKKYNELVSNNMFNNPSNLPPPPDYIYSDASYPDAGNPNLLPIVYPKATATHKNSAYSVFSDDDNIVQFRHRTADGRINKHDGPNQQVALSRLMGHIRTMNDSTGSEDFGKCWQHTYDNYYKLDFLDNKKVRPPQCTARLYPEEILHAINSATYTDPSEKEGYLNILAYYKKLFVEKFKEPIGVVGMAPTAATNKPNAPMYATASNSKDNNSNSNNNNNSYNNNNSNYNSNSNNSNNNQEGGKRWKTRKRKHYLLKRKSYRMRTA